ncbi:hypothetical protein [Akkermansia sp.]|uniref:hypothetical protein n=1 Tax=Akkermansia sp. TaxID=1872421 RepID=UPI0025C44242|nr:hypothetical protein [Akkermansia sp.]MCC8149117.1 hypothetical protein [Akkermansia sp.]
MILTKSQLDRITALFEAQELPDTFPDDADFEFMETIAGDMTLDDYLALPEAARRKWWISSEIDAVRPLGFTDLDTGEDLYQTGFYFEPVAPNILDRIY